MWSLKKDYVREDNYTEHNVHQVYYVRKSDNRIEGPRKLYLFNVVTYDFFWDGFKEGESLDYAGKNYLFPIYKKIEI
jgi:hypothetical protein